VAEREAPLYTELLGPAWAALSGPVAALHATSAGARGAFRVRRGGGLLARLLGALLRMPAACERVAIELRVERGGGVERWVRRFGEQPLHTEQWGEGGMLVEGMGPFQCRFRLRVEGGSLLFEQGGATVGFRWGSVPLPRFLWPRVEGRADGDGEQVAVDVRIFAPVVGLLVAYDGRVTPEAAR